MKFSKIKIISLLLVGSGFLGLSTFASADDLKIGNDTKYDLSFSIDNICSKELGVVENHSMKVVSKKNFNKACASNPEECKVQVYDADSCAGKVVAEVVFNKDAGVIALYSKGIVTKGNGFNLFLEGPWLNK